MFYIIIDYWVIIGSETQILKLLTYSIKESPENVVNQIIYRK